MPRFPRVNVDDVARSLAALGSRRGVLRALGGGFLIGLATSGHDPDGIASARGRPRKRRQSPARCQKPGARCNQRKRCCQGTRCRRGKCQCPHAKKLCGTACVPKARCCRSSGHGCASGAKPDCPPDHRPCGDLCILADGCCNNADCNEACHTGTCFPNHTCQFRSIGQSCRGDASRKCNSDHVCSQPCETDDDCPLPLEGEPSSAEEYCRERQCENGENGVCLLGTKRPYTEIPPEFQSGKECEVRVCFPGQPERYGLFDDQVAMDATLRPHDNECLKWTCHTPGRRAVDPVPLAGKPCAENTGVCDNSGNCVANP